MNTVQHANDDAMACSGSDVPRRTRTKTDDVRFWWLGRPIVLTSFFRFSCSRVLSHRQTLHALAEV